MYEPTGDYSPSLAFLWPAFVAASVSEMTGQAAKQFADLAVGPDGAAATEPRWATANAIAFELKTVRLRDFTVRMIDTPTLVCAPLASHSAVITDFAPGHSLVMALRSAGIRRLFVTDWRSATAEMRFHGIDDYLADLNVLVDEIGGPVDLIGLCQGGWMALIYAARFPAKVRKLVLAGAPIDLTAAPSPLSALAHASPLALYHGLLRIGDGLVPGRKVMKFWAVDSVAADDMRQVLQTDGAAGCISCRDRPRALKRGRARVSHGLRECHELLIGKPQRPREFGIVDGSAKDRCEFFRGAEQIDILTDERSIDRGVQSTLLCRDICHALAVSDIDQIERSGRYKVLITSLPADIVREVKQQGVRHRLVNEDPVSQRHTDVDHHHMTPVRRRTLAARAINAESRPK